MTAGLINTLAEHALGNYRVLTTMAAELLARAAQHERPQLDEQLYLEVFEVPAQGARKRARPSQTGDPR
jgi:general secretion pathway protein A